MADAARRADLAAIHIAKKDRQLEDEDYRLIIRRISGGRTESSANLALQERKQLLAELAALPRRRPSERPFKKAKRPQARLVWALWGELKRRGALDNPSREACRAFCAKTAGIEAATDPDLMMAAQLDPVISALKAWVARKKAKGSSRSEVPA